MNRVRIAIVTRVQEPSSFRRLSDWATNIVTGRPVTYVLLLVLILLSVAQSGMAQIVKFSPAVSYPTGPGPKSLATGDFNRDGKVDLAVVTNVNRVDLLLGNGNGSFQPPVSLPLKNPGAIVAGDFNRDGNLDLVTTNEGGIVSVLLGNGDGTFQSAVNYSTGTNPGPIVTADFNRDGYLDLAMGNGVYLNPTVTILLGIGDGSFRAPVSYALTPNSAAAAKLAVGDFNGDGKIDLVTANGSGSNGISVFLGNGDGTFRSSINFASPAPAFTLAVGDFDRDGKLDVAFFNGFAVIMLGNGDGTFKPGPSYSLGNIQTDAQVGDFNGDGRLDLVAVGIFGGKVVQMLLGNGDGTFQSTGGFVDSTGGIAITVADFNGDTRPDLAACVNGQLMVALLNVTPGNVDNTDYFVHQHYLDFLDREPDASGFGFWTDQITSCRSDQGCIEQKRANVSAAFALSTEFQQTAYLVERMYKTAYGDATGTSMLGGSHQVVVPIARLNELLMDTEQIGQGVVVGQAGWDTVLENNKQSLIAHFVQRSRFVTAFPTTLTPAEFVDKLNQNAGNVLSSSERAMALDLFGNAMDTSNTSARAQALRQIAENQKLYDSEFNRAFVLMEYFGYLRRNANEGHDADYSGYDFWLQKLNQFNGDFQKSEMVKAFITSTEYRQRFGP